MITDHIDLILKIERSEGSPVRFVENDLRYDGENDYLIFKGEAVEVHVHPKGKWYRLYVNDDFGKHCHSISDYMSTDTIGSDTLESIQKRVNALQERLTLCYKKKWFLSEILKDYEEREDAKNDTK